MPTPEEATRHGRIAALSHDQMRFGLFLVGSLSAELADEILDAAEKYPTGDQPCNC